MPTAQLEQPQSDMMTPHDQDNRSTNYSFSSQGKQPAIIPAPDLPVATMIIVHSENSTAEPIWHPSSPIRGTWNIYQTCVITIFLCVWTTIHLNVPPPGQKASKQVLSRIKWSLLTIIAPEWVALSAWAQYRDASELMREINRLRLSTAPESQLRHLVNSAAFICLAPCRVLDWLIVRRCNVKKSRSLARERDMIRSAEEECRIDDTRLAWTMSMAFYVLSGGCVHRSKHLERCVVQPAAVLWLAENEPEALLPLQRVVLQNPSKANGVAKAVTCVQALWFCMQCSARLGEDLAVSLLELNTFAHCLSTLFIYIFWWQKPYEVEAHVLLDSHALHLVRLKAFHGIGRLTIQTRNGHDAHGPSTKRPGSGLCSILDESGKELFDQPYEHPSWNHDTVSPANAPILMDLRLGMINIPGTGFYVSCLPIQDAHDQMLSTPHWQIRRWQALWHSWVDLDLPTVTRPIRNTPGDGLWFDYRNRNIKLLLADYLSIEEWSILVPLIMTFTFAIYGGLHLLAWHYEFGTTAESLLWKIASITTASSGLLFLQMNLGAALADKNAPWCLEDCSPSQRFYRRILRLIGVALAYGTTPFSLVINILGRSFLIIESFKALPNSPLSTYSLVNWTTYIPHI